MMLTQDQQRLIIALESNRYDDLHVYHAPGVIYRLHDVLADVVHAGACCV